jgi:hypothetical protein
MNRKSAEFWWNLPIKGVERKPIKPAPEVAYYEKQYKGHILGDAPKDLWKPVTWNEVFEERKQKQKIRLQYKRRSNEAQTKHCYIWVFHVDWFLFGGWWIYLKFHKDDIALNFRSPSSYKGIISKIKSHFFPDTLFLDLISTEELCKFIAKKYPSKAFKRKKNQGLYKCECVIDSYGEVKDIILK